MGKKKDDEKLKKMMQSVSPSSMIRDGFSDMASGKALGTTQAGRQKPLPGPRATVTNTKKTGRQGGASDRKQQTQTNQARFKKPFEIPRGKPMAQGKRDSITKALIHDSLKWHTTTNAETRAALHAANNERRNALGLTYDTSTGQTLNVQGRKQVTTPVEIAFGETTGALQHRMKEHAENLTTRESPEVIAAAARRRRAQQPSITRRLATAIDSAKESVLGGHTNYFETGSQQAVQKAEDRFLHGGDENISWLDKQALRQKYGADWLAQMQKRREATQNGDTETLRKFEELDNTSALLWGEGSAMMQDAAEQQERAKDGVGKIGSAALDITNMGAQMLANAAIAGQGGQVKFYAGLKPTGGAGISEYLIRNGPSALFTATSSLQHAGQGADKAKQLGKDATEQMRYANAIGLTNALIESRGGAGEVKIPVVSQMTDKLIPAALQRMGATTAGKVLSNAAEEGLENAIQYEAERRISNSMLDTNETFDPVQLAAETASGAAMGGIFGGAQAIGDRIHRSASPRLEMRYGEKPGASLDRMHLDNEITTPYNGAKGVIANGSEGERTPAPISGDAGDANVGGRTGSGKAGTAAATADPNAGTNPQETEQFGKVTYRYTKTPDAAVTDTARQVSSLLKEYGIETVIHNGDMQRNIDGSVSARPMVAATSPDGRVFIANDMDMQPAEVAGHEKVHHFAKANPKAMTDFMENTLQNNLNYQSIEVMSALDKIAETYIAGDYDLSNPRQSAKVFEEFAAYLSGWREQGTDAFRRRYGDWFTDPEKVENGYRNIDALLRERAGQGTANSQALGSESANIDMRALLQAHQNKIYAQENMERVEAGLQLTDQDRRLIDAALMAGDDYINFYLADNPQDALYAFEARQAVKDAEAPIRKYQAARQEEMQLRAAESADIIAKNAKDKGRGLLYQRETMERNLYDIFGKKNRREAEQLIEQYFVPVHQAVAEGNKLKEQLRSTVKALKLDADESTLVQMRLEGEDGAAAEYIREKNLQITPERSQKIEQATTTLQKIYNTLYEQMNETLLRNGQPPVTFRKNYAPHFMENNAQTLPGRIAQAMGIYSPKADTLPTDLAGITETFRPGKKFFANLLPRTGDQTVFDAVKGFDQYIETAADVITLTDSIQELRALEDGIRYRLSDAGTQEKINEIRQNRQLDTLEKRRQTEEIYDETNIGMRNLVTELRRYTDNLAGKKSREDRGWEDAIGRDIYQVAKNVEGRNAANMLAANLGSALTNFIPITQATAEIPVVDLLSGMRDTVQSFIRADDLVHSSTFLTNRHGSESISKTTGKKIADALGKPMDWVDQLVSGSIVRARYAQNMKKGMDIDASMREADSFAAGLMADRSKGATPTLFHAKNPATKALTMFQLEVNNQISYMVKDLPRRMGEQGAAAVAGALTKIFVTAFLYNQIYEKLTGRRAAFDPIGAIADAFGIDDGDGEANPLPDALESLGKSALEQTPFVGGLIGGGRIPISSMLPNFGKLYTAATDSEKAPAKRLDMISKELIKPAAYMLPPFGGGAIKKAIEGYNTVRSGGSYTLDNDGKQVLQFPQYRQSPVDYAKAMLFGKYSSNEAQEYIDSGFDRLNPAETEVYAAAEKHGMDKRAAYEAIQKVAEAPKDSSKTDIQAKREAILALDLTAGQKAWLDFSLLGGADRDHTIDYKDENSFKITSQFQNREKQEAAQQALDQYGVPVDTFAQYDTALRAADKAPQVSRAQAREEVYQQIQTSGLEDTVQQGLIEQLLLKDLSDNRQKLWNGEYQKSIRPDQYFQIANKYAEIDTQYDDYKGEYQKAAAQTTEFWKYIKSMEDIAPEIQEKILEDFKYYSQNPARPIAYRWDMLTNKREKEFASALSQTNLPISVYNEIKLATKKFKAHEARSYVRNREDLTKQQQDYVIQMLGYAIGATGAKSRGKAQSKKKTTQQKTKKLKKIPKLTMTFGR